MFKKMFMKVGAEAARREQEAFLQLVKVGTDSEMANSLACAAIARRVLDSTEEPGPSSFPEDLFRGGRAIDDNAKAELSMYSLYLGARRKNASSNPDPVYQCLAAGYSVYMFSFRSLVRGELFPTGRQIWAELMRGSHGYREAMSVLAPKLSESEWDSLFPAPNVLAPGEI